MDDTILEDEPGLDVSDDDVQSNGRGIVCHEGEYLSDP
jgi:hypothetical protein